MAGAEKVAAYRTFFRRCYDWLKPGGWLVMELGFGTVGHVEALLAEWSEVRVAPDLAGIPRVIAARR